MAGLAGGLQIMRIALSSFNNQTFRANLLPLPIQDPS